MTSFAINKEQLNALKSKFGNNLIQKCQIENRRHVVVLFEGINLVFWGERSQKPIPENDVSTVAEIRRGVVSGYPPIQKPGEELATEAYATDIDDDVKILAKEFIKSNRRGNGKVIIYGYSWGGDTAVELAKDLNDEGIPVDLLVTIDAALGPSSHSLLARDITIPENVDTNINHYTTTPRSILGSAGLWHVARNRNKTKISNIKHKGPSHADMDEKTMTDSISRILHELAGN